MAEFPDGARQLSEVRAVIRAAVRSPIAHPVNHAVRSGHLVRAEASPLIVRQLNGVLHELTRAKLQPAILWSAGLRIFPETLPAAAQLQAPASPGGQVVVMRGAMADARDALGVALAAGRNASSDPAHHQVLADLADMLTKLDALRRRAEAA